MKVAFFDLEGWEAPIYKQKFAGTMISAIEHGGETAMLDAENIRGVKEAEVLSVSFSRVDRGVIDSLPGLKLVGTRSTGYDNVDVEYAKKKGIAVANVPTYGEETVAEYTFALILTLARKLSQTFLRTLFGYFSQKELRGMDLAGKTLGVVGTGRIASRVVKMAHAFEMKILCYDLYTKPELVDKYGAKYVPLEELLRNADVVTIHVPYTKDTHHLINPDTIKLLKPGALLVNAARGPIVDVSAVLAAVKDGRLGGVALDTFEGEQVWIKQEEMLLTKDELLPPAEAFKKALESFYLLRFRNVVLTPHNAYNSREAVERILNTNLDCIVAFAQTGTCDCRVA
jgi:D-lactate dehydrogenase